MFSVLTCLDLMIINMFVINMFGYLFKHLMGHFMGTDQEKNKYEVLVETLMLFWSQ